MANDLKRSVAKLFLAIAIILQAIYIITTLLSLIHVKIDFGSPGEFLHGLLSKLELAVVALLSLIFLLIDYRIFKTTGRSVPKARDYALVFGIIEILFGLILLPTLIPGLLLLLAWISLEL